MLRKPSASGRSVPLGLKMLPLSVFCILDVSRKLRKYIIKYRIYVCAYNKVPYIRVFSEIFLKRLKRYTCTHEIN